jgi:hypothetical protein
MAKKQLTRTLDTSTAEGQEAALRLLQQATQIQAPAAAPIAATVIAPVVEAEIETEAPPQYVAPKKALAPKPKVEKRGRPAKGDPNEGGSIKLIADGSSVKRINMDFPLDMYERIEAEIDETGQTVKGFFLMLAKQYFKSRNSTPSV